MNSLHHRLLHSWKLDSTTQQTWDARNLRDFRWIHPRPLKLNVAWIIKNTFIARFKNNQQIFREMLLINIYTPVDVSSHQSFIVQVRYRRAVGCLWHSTSEKSIDCVLEKLRWVRERREGEGEIVIVLLLSCRCRKRIGVFPAYNHKIWIFINISRTIKLSFYFSRELPYSLVSVEIALTSSREVEGARRQWIFDLCRMSMDVKITRSCSSAKLFKRFSKATLATSSVENI